MNNTATPDRNPDDRPQPGAYASHPLDKMLRDWRNPEIAADLFIDEDIDDEDLNDDLHSDAATRPAVEAAGQALYAAIADFVDAVRSDPTLSYAAARMTLQDILDDLPEPPDSLAEIRALLDEDDAPGPADD